MNLVIQLAMFVNLTHKNNRLAPLVHTIGYVVAEVNPIVGSANSAVVVSRPRIHTAILLLRHFNNPLKRRA
jgi:hypothetical protein